MTSPLAKSISILNATDTAHLDELLFDENKRVRLLPAAELAAISRNDLRVWCLRNARYQLPTTELIAYLKEKIGPRSAIEVGAGMGDIGYHLGIPMSDSYIQSTPDLINYYRSLGQIPTTPPPDVERMDAEKAVKIHKPQVVIACWLTQKFQEGDTEGSVFGPDESVILHGCQTYIHVGNDNSHFGKRLLKRPHTALHVPWLVSRAADPTKNVIYQWEK